MPRNAAIRVDDIPVPHRTRPMISVCMASYNGELYIQEQIRSILSQLSRQDELVVVDDASTDRTKERVIEFDDPRIKLVEHVRNRGVVETFEEAVQIATGEILFLSDGDDIWAPDKLTNVLQAFAETPRAQVVVTGLNLIDGDGKMLDRDDYLKHRTFRESLHRRLI